MPEEISGKSTGKRLYRIPYAVWYRRIENNSPSMIVDHFKKGRHSLVNVVGVPCFIEKFNQWKLVRLKEWLLTLVFSKTLILVHNGLFLCSITYRHGVSKRKQILGSRRLFNEDHTQTLSACSYASGR
jgi:hypothetical protein